MVPIPVGPLVEVPRGNALSGRPSTGHSSQVPPDAMGEWRQHSIGPGAPGGAPRSAEQSPPLFAPSCCQGAVAITFPVRLVPAEMPASQRRTALPMTAPLVRSSSTGKSGVHVFARQGGERSSMALVQVSVHVLRSPAAMMKSLLSD